MFEIAQALSALDFATGEAILICNRLYFCGDEMSRSEAEGLSNALGVQLAMIEQSSRDIRDRLRSDEYEAHYSDQGQAPELQANQIAHQLFEALDAAQGQASELQADNADFVLRIEAVQRENAALREALESAERCVACVVEIATNGSDTDKLLAAAALAPSTPQEDA